MPVWRATSSSDLASGWAGRSTEFAVSAAAPKPVKQIAAGIEFACALLESGDVQCWGDNSRNQLGPNAVDAGMTASAPITVLAGAAAVGTASDAACALMSDTSVRCWGDDTYGELGRGFRNASTYYPTPVAAMAQY